jgi:hypothetical protein
MFTLSTGHISVLYAFPTAAHTSPVSSSPLPSPPLTFPSKACSFLLPFLYGMLFGGFTLRGGLELVQNDYMTGIFSHLI